jgi:hypothetical protein
MRHVLFAIVVVSTAALCQDCTTAVVVNVFDDHLHLDVQTLKADDFQARMDGTDLAIVSSQQGYNSRLLVLLETDGAADDPKIGNVVDTVTRIARQAPEGKPVAFGIYADKTFLTPHFLADPEKRSAEIDDVIEQANSLGKRVALFDALYQGLQLFGEHQPGDTVLLVGSPYDDKSKHSLGAVEKRFLATGTRLMAMLRQPMSRVSRSDFMLNNHAREKSLFLDFAEQTGGAHSEFDPRFFGFAWRGYMLDVKVPERVHKPHSWSLRIHGLKEGLFKHTKIFYPESLLPCTVAEASTH